MGSTVLVLTEGLPCSGCERAPMDKDEFTRLALELPDAWEAAHGGHPDFRVKAGVFASLGYPDAYHGMVKLTPEQSEMVCAAAPDVFAPAKGAWGRAGSTIIRLAALDGDTARSVLKMAWENRSAPPVRRKRGSQGPD